MNKIFTPDEKRLMVRATEVSTLILTTIMPVSLIWLFYNIKNPKTIKMIYLYPLMGLFLFYLTAGIRFRDYELLFMAGVLAILPAYLISRTNNKDLLHSLQIGVILLSIIVLIDFIFSLILHFEIKRAIGLQHNAFNTTTILVFTGIIFSYHNKSNWLLFFIGFTIGFPFSRSGLILPLFSRRNQIPFILIGIFISVFIIILPLSKLTEQDVAEKRINIVKSIEIRNDLATQPDYQIINGLGLGQYNKQPGINQNPHNTFLSAVAQLGLIFAIPFLLAIYIPLFFYGYKYGFWKLTPILIYDFIDGQLISSYAIAAITIIYLYLMAQKPIINNPKITPNTTG